MQILNIDDFARPKRALRIGGVDHPLRDLSVQQFIDNLKAAVELEQKVSENASVDLMIAELNRSVDMVVESIPSLSRETVAGWSPDLIGEVLRFIRGELDTKVKAAEQGVAPDQEGAEKKALS